MAVDGASGPKGYGGGIVFTTPKGFKIYHAIVFNFKLTNNEAKYEALAGGLKLAQALKISRVSIKSESSLIIGQVTGNMEVREGRMAQYKDLVLALLKGFEEFKIAPIPRAENADADLLSKLTQYAPEHVSKLARVEILDRASIEKLEAAAIIAGSQSNRSNLVGVDDHWMYDVMEFLMDGSLPEQEDRARKVKLRAPRFKYRSPKDSVVASGVAVITQAASALFSPTHAAAQPGKLSSFSAISFLASETSSISRLFSSFSWEISAFIVPASADSLINSSA
ncbi:unnamed protein product [Cuscuta campestris]|uniref:RNase H type-1 domain-containing protein n=1 Tax=Cuscuta campestris TaxID=132261 RepID=A0A484KNJ8_9ASTE|nr:unnamed protein product [Cuscuta campestris]